MNNPVLDSLLFLTVARSTLCEYYETLEVDRLSDVRRFIKNDATDYQIMELMVTGKLSTDYDPVREQMLWEALRQSIIMENEGLLEALDDDLVQSFLFEMGPVHEFGLSSATPILEFHIQSGHIHRTIHQEKIGFDPSSGGKHVLKNKLPKPPSKEELARRQKEYEAKKGKDDPVAKWAKTQWKKLKGYVSKKGEKEETSDKKIEPTKKTQVVRKKIEAPKETKPVKKDPKIPDKVVAAKTPEPPMPSKKGLAKPEKPEPTVAKSEKTPEGGTVTQASGGEDSSKKKDKDTKRTPVTKAVKDAITSRWNKLTPQAKGAAKATAAIGAAALIGIAANKIYQKHFSKAAKACKGSDDKTACMAKFKADARSAKIAKLKAGLGKCKNYQCKATVQRKIDKEVAKGI